MNIQIQKLVLAITLLIGAITAQAQVTAFTYQGRLNVNGTPANGSYDLQFYLRDASGNPVGATNTITSVAVGNGLFTVSLDFGSSPFTDANRWLEIGVRTNGGGLFVTLAPRQLLTATPYAITAVNLAGVVANNTISGSFATVGGGQNNSSSGNYSAVAGGSGNTSSSVGATVGGGSLNESSGIYATVGGGGGNTNSSYAATVGGGLLNISSGDFATIPGGERNTAAGHHSFAAGRRAKATNDGAFVWADSQDADFASTTNDQFSIRARGGVRLSDNTPSLSFGSQTRQMLNLWGTQYGIGVQTSTLYFRTDGTQADHGFAWFKGGIHSDAETNSGGGATLMRLDGTGLTVNGTVTATAFNPSSDRNVKENFTPVSPRDVLAKVAALPISQWNFKGDAATPHVGPMAQDFHTTFGLGTDDKHIATVDADGVALAAIQGLNEVVKEKDAEIQELKRAVKELKESFDKLARSSRSEQSSR